MERTLIIVKPDAVQRGLTGEIIRRFEQRGLKIVGMKFMQVSRELAQKHYAEHEGKPFYEGLVAYITSSPVVVMVLEAKNCVELARNMIGKTKPVEALPGTIRGDFGVEVGRNLVHGSDSPTSAERELALWFAPQELAGWMRVVEPWIHE
ncbi:MAG: nucleoside-diphosphate kinase [Anaerolineae bacterium]|nr:nucleoside-diphosphate kinase [Anaerolineae bacterium]NUQ03234.1 nucleoside-diphosphate kinase [Anaerolineae bacterium]